MENNSSKDRRGGKLTDPIHHPRTLSNSNPSPLPAMWGYPGSRPRLCFSLPSARTDLPLPRGSAEQGAAPHPSQHCPQPCSCRSTAALGEPGWVRSAQRRSYHCPSELNHIRGCYCISLCFIVRERHRTLNYSRANNNTLGQLANWSSQYYFPRLHISLFSLSQFSHFTHLPPLALTHTLKSIHCSLEKPNKGKRE